MAVITNYTSYDQAYYYADLKRLPRLSEEERRRLTASLPLANDPQLTTRIKHQLIESYLPLAKYFAIDLCPKSRYQRDLPDLIGVANLTVVEVITRTDLAQIDDPTSYLAAWARCCGSRGGAASVGVMGAALGSCRSSESNHSICPSRLSRWSRA